MQMLLSLSFQILDFFACDVRHWNGSVYDPWSWIGFGSIHLHFPWTFEAI
jgi:hypothetical protein